MKHRVWASAEFFPYGLLRHYEQLTNQEAAELLKLEPKTASKRYGPALRRLRDKLMEQGGEPVLLTGKPKKHNELTFG